MANLLLTPVNLPGTGGLVLPATGAQSLSGFTGFTFVNNGEMWIALYVGLTGAGNLTQNFGRTVEGAIPAPVVVALTALTNYLFGPWSPSDFAAHDGTGLTYFGLSGTQTLNSVTLYQSVPLQ